jgi:hypothetical protein
MTLLVRLTNGTTTLNLTDGTNYAIPYNEWTPAVAPVVGGSDAGDVVETIPLHVRGATGPAAMANLRAVIDMLVQAEQHRANMNLAAVVLEYRPSNSSTIWRARVVGQVGNESLLRLSPRVTDAANYEIDGISIRLWRKGLWLNPVVTSATHSNVTNGTVAEMAFSTDWPPSSPCKMRVANFRLGAAGTQYNSNMMLFSDRAKSIAHFSAHTMTAAQFTAVSDSANFSLGGSYLRFTPAVAGTSYLSGSLIIPTADFDTDTCRRVAIYVNARSFSDTNEFSIRAEFGRMFIAAVRGQLGSWITITGPSAGGPMWRLLGVISVPTQPTHIRLEAKGLTTDGTLGIDSIALLNLSEPNSTSLAFVAPSYFDSGVVFVEHRILTHINPLLYIDETLFKPVTATGNKTIFCRNNKLYGTWLATGGTGGGSSVLNWRATVSGSLLVNSWVADRLPATFVPE